MSRGLVGVDGSVEEGEVRLAKVQIGVRAEKRDGNRRVRGMKGLLESLEIAGELDSGS